MDDAETDAGAGQKLRAWIEGISPMNRAAAGAAALVFLLGMAMPNAWVSSLSWNLYLDRIGSWFAPPVGGVGRVVLAIALALLAGAVVMLALLLRAKPVADDDDWTDIGFSVAAPDEGEADETTRRRRIDRHPDAPPRPLIRAASDLPAEGLGPVLPTADDTAVTPPEADNALAEEDLAEADLIGPDPGEDDFLDLSLADVAPAEDAILSGDEAPTADAAPVAAVQAPLPTDASLGSMVARFEAGLDRRRRMRGQGPDAANEDGEPEIDFALEAALSTLQRMTRHAVG